jgi:hypothetical protein
MAPKRARKVLSILALALLLAPLATAQPMLLTEHDWTIHIGTARYGICQWKVPPGGLTGRTTVYCGGELLTLQIRAWKLAALVFAPLSAVVIFGRAGRWRNKGGITKETGKFEVELRFAVAGLLELILFLFGLASDVSYPSYASEVWTHYWIACVAALAVAVLCPLFWRGALWQRVLAALLCLFPCLLFCAVMADHFELLPTWPSKADHFEVLPTWPR